MEITFLGATGTVTGSKYQITYAKNNVLVDCGLFQGLKQLRIKNWSPIPINTAHLNAVLLTHAHLDHSGYLPKLVQQGFTGHIYCTPATRDLCRILLLDSAKIMEEEADMARRFKYSKHQNPQPLYTEADVEKTLKLFKSIEWNQPIQLKQGLEVEFYRAGHILGASMINLRHAGQSLTFSGDLGRQNDPLFPPPDDLPKTDYLVVESTYGDRIHENSDPLNQLKEIINAAFANKSVVVIPSFAVGRTQAILFRLWELKKAGELPHIPIFVDSPMATNVTKLYSEYPNAHSLGERLAQDVFDIAHYIQDGNESRMLANHKGPMVLISASGMATGGRILAHLKTFLPNANNTVVLSGFQAAGTRGAALAAGVDQIKIRGEYIPVRAKVASLGNFSAHADANEILRWLKTSPAPIKRVFITHGEPVASDSLRKSIEETFAWNCIVPEYRDVYNLDSLD